MHRIILLLLVAIILPVLVLDVLLQYATTPPSVKDAINNVHVLQFTTHAILITILIILLTSPQLTISYSGSGDGERKDGRD